MDACNVEVGQAPCADLAITLDAPIDIVESRHGVFVATATPLYIGETCQRHNRLLAVGTPALRRHVRRQAELLLGLLELARVDQTHAAAHGQPGLDIGVTGQVGGVDLRPPHPVLGTRIVDHALGVLCRHQLRQHQLPSLPLLAEEHGRLRKTLAGSLALTRLHLRLTNGRQQLGLQ